MVWRRSRPSRRRLNATGDEVHLFPGDNSQGDEGHPRGAHPCHRYRERLYRHNNIMKYILEFRHHAFLSMRQPRLFRPPGMRRDRMLVKHSQSRLARDSIFWRGRSPELANVDGRAPDIRLCSPIVDTGCSPNLYTDCSTDVKAAGIASTTSCRARSSHRPWVFCDETPMPVIEPRRGRTKVCQYLAHVWLIRLDSNWCPDTLLPLACLVAHIAAP